MADTGGLFRPLDSTVTCHRPRRRRPGTSVGIQVGLRELSSICCRFTPWNPCERSPSQRLVRHAASGGQGMKNRKLWLGAAWLALIAALGFAQAELQRAAAVQGAAKPQAPIFEVDPLWPKPLP